MAPTNRDRTARIKTYAIVNLIISNLEGMIATEPVLPLVSVITVVFNGEKFIEKTMKNVLGQNYSNIEYILIDGGSTDRTLEIVDRYNSRLTYFVSEPDRGIYDAMNKGIDVARGTWVIFMNAGDEFKTDDTVSKSVIQMHGNASIFYGGVEICYPGFSRVENPGPIIKLWQGMQFCHQSAFINLQYHKLNKYNINNLIAADLEFFFSAYRKGMKFGKLNCVISKVITGGLSENSRVSTLIASCNAVCKNEPLYFIRAFYGILIVDAVMRILAKSILPKTWVRKIIINKQRSKYED